MTKSSKNTLAVIALAACMTICTSVALTGIANTAYADAGSSISTASVDTSETVIAEGLTITDGTSATANVGNIAGQYYVYVTIQENVGDNYDPYELYVTVGGQTVTLAFNYNVGRYEGVIRVTDGAVLEVSTNSKNTLVVNVALGDLYLGATNGYTIDGVEFSAESPLTVNLEDAEESSYILTVNLDGGNRNGGKISVNISGVPDDLVDNGEGVYTLEVSLSPDTATLTISTTSTETLHASVNLLKIVHYDRLPSTVTLTRWETATYEYSVGTSGYYSIDVWSDTDETADVYVTMKTEADAWEGTEVVGENYPLYMNADTTYYFDLVLAESENEQTTVSIEVSDWNKPTVELNSVYYVPVAGANTASSSVEFVELTLNAAAGEYNLSLVNVPYVYYMSGVTVTATVDGTEYYLSSLNNYAVEVTTASDNAKVSFRTSEETGTVLGVNFATPEVKNYITLDEKTDVEVAADSTVAYYIESVETGYYNIVLEGLSADALLNVYTSESDVAVVPYGELSGGFQVRWGGDFAILFTNDGSTDLDFNVTVSKAIGQYAVELAKEQTITLEADAVTTYYIEGLAQGNYEITLSDPNVSVWVDGAEVQLTNGKGSFVLTGDQDSSGIVSVSFKSAAASSLTVTVMPLDLLELGVAVNLKADAWYYGTNAYYIHLTKGTYSVALYLPDNLYGTVTVNNEYINYNVFTVEEDSYVAIRIIAYSFTDAELDFKAVVNPVGTMEKYEDESVALSAGNFSKTYAIELEADTYGIILSDYAGTGEVQVTANGETVIEYGSDAGTITVSENTTVYLTFTYNGTATIDFVAFIY